MHIDILGVSETHWTNETTETFQKKHVIIHSCTTDYIHQQGAPTILKEKLAKQLVDYNLINERIMLIQLKTVQEPLFVFQVYAPDSFYSQGLKDKCYPHYNNKLTNYVGKIEKLSCKTSMEKSAQMV